MSPVQAVNLNGPEYIRDRRARYQAMAASHGIDLDHGDEDQDDEPEARQAPEQSVPRLQSVDPPVRPLPDPDEQGEHFAEDLPPEQARGSRFLRAEGWVLEIDNRQLCQGAKITLAEIRWRCKDLEDEFQLLDQKKMAKRLGMPERTLKRHVAKLKEQGWIVPDYHAAGRTYKLIQTVAVNEKLRAGKRLQWAPIPAWMLQRLDISDGAKLAYALLLMLASGRTVAVAVQSRMGPQLGVSDRQIRYYLDELENYGLIWRRQPGWGKPNCYGFLNHPIVHPGIWEPLS